MSTAPKKYVSATEYLDADRRASVRSEYFQGEVFAMTGASREHNLIALNIASELRNRLRDRDCEVYQADMRVKVRSTGLYAYPDIVVTCDHPEFEDENVDTLLNPTLLIEVLSPTTADYDRGGKFAQYRRLASLREYVLVSQDRVWIEHYRREAEDEWRFHEQSSRDGALVLSSIGCSVPLAEIYLKVNFAAPIEEVS